MFVLLECEQPQAVHFCFEPSTKDLRYVLDDTSSAGQIHVGICRFHVFAKLEVHLYGIIHCSNIEVKKIYSVVLVPVILRHTA